MWRRIFGEDDEDCVVCFNDCIDQQGVDEDTCEYYCMNDDTDKVQQVYKYIYLQDFS